MKDKIKIRHFYFPAGALLCLLAAVLLVGCGSPQPSPPVQSLWQFSTITADGNPKDWPDTAPLYHDPENQTRMWVANDENAIYLLVTIHSQETKNRLATSGFSLVLDTDEKDAKPFSLNFDGTAPFGFPREQTEKPNPQPNNGKPAPMPDTQDLNLPEMIEVIYPYSSGAMTMSLAEAMENGIALSVGNPESGTWVFEAKIRMDAVFFERPLVSGSQMSVSLSAQEGVSPEGRRSPDPGEESGKHPGSFEAKVTVLLAPGSSG